MIVVFSTGGRTGNQLFQMAYVISNRRRRELVVTFGFGKTMSLLSDGPWRRNWLDIDNRGFGRILEAVLYPAMYHCLVRTSLASLHTDVGSVPVVRRSRLGRLVIVKGYFESPSLHVEDLRDFFRLEPALVQKVRPVVEALPAGCVPVFVHVRRGDLVELTRTYKDGFKLLLPDTYYQEAVNLFLQRHPDAFFLIVGDDPEHAEAIFRTLDSKQVSRRTVTEDLALMSLCPGGVLSNSTFSWWGAFFGSRELGFVVPKDWPRSASPAWEPRGALPPFLHPA